MTTLATDRCTICNHRPNPAHATCGDPPLQPQRYTVTENGRLETFIEHTCGFCSLLMARAVHAEVRKLKAENMAKGGI